MSRTCLLVLFSTLCVVALGCGPATPRSKLTGEWKGAPDISGEVDQYVDHIKASGGDEGQQMLAEGFGKTIGSFAARQTLGVDLDLQSDGSAAIGGESQRTLTVLPGQKGTWEVSDKEPATMKIMFGDKVFEGKVTFRDEDAFFFQFEAPIEATTAFSEIATQQPGEKQGEGEEKPKTKPATFLFRRKGAVREM